ncbi:MAG TPA: hypothetical protein VF215_17330 [Thermoanaerobaculia bacterium]|jgi:hypothetical protein
MNESSEVRRKKAYDKPTVVRFPLRPEEAVLGFCKTTGGNGPSGGNCVSLGVCRIAGS